MEGDSKGRAGDSRIGEEGKGTGASGGRKGLLVEVWTLAPLPMMPEHPWHLPCQHEGAYRAKGQFTSCSAVVGIALL